MARIIDLQFKDKTYSIEYNRESIVKLMAKRSQSDDTFDLAINLVECGLMKNHKNDMPDREEIIGWLLAMGDDLKPFVEALQKNVEEVINLIKDDQKSKNLKWVVRA